MKRSPQVTQKPKASGRPAMPSTPAKSAKQGSVAAQSLRPKSAVKHASKPVATKQARLITLLRSASGATMQQMMAMTGWQAHTVRGMLSGSLRKRLGLTVQQQPVQGVRVYRIVKGSAS